MQKVINKAWEFIKNANRAITDATKAQLAQHFNPDKSGQVDLRRSRSWDLIIAGFSTTVMVFTAVVVYQ